MPSTWLSPCYFSSLQKGVPVFGATALSPGPFAREALVDDAGRLLLKLPEPPLPGPRRSRSISLRVGGDVPLPEPQLDQMALWIVLNLSSDVERDYRLTLKPMRHVPITGSSEAKERSSFTRTSPSVEGVPKTPFSTQATPSSWRVALGG